jgi:hypothetical protein
VELRFRGKFYKPLRGYVSRAALAMIYEENSRVDSEKGIDRYACGCTL